MQPPLGETHGRRRMETAALLVAKPRRFDRLRRVYVVGVHTGRRANMGSPPESRGRRQRSGYQWRCRYIRGGEGSSTLRGKGTVAVLEMIDNWGYRRCHLRYGPQPASRAAK